MTGGVIRNKFGDADGRLSILGDDVKDRAAVYQCLKIQRLSNMLMYKVHHESRVVKAKNQGLYFCGHDRGSYPLALVRSEVQNLASSRRVGH